LPPGYLRPACAPLLPVPQRFAVTGGCQHSRS